MGNDIYNSDLLPATLKAPDAFKDAVTTGHFLTDSSKFFLGRSRDREIIRCVRGAISVSF